MGEGGGRDGKEGEGIGNYFGEHCWKLGRVHWSKRGGFFVCNLECGVQVDGCFIMKEHRNLNGDLIHIR